MTEEAAAAAAAAALTPNKASFLEAVNGDDSVRAQGGLVALALDEVPVGREGLYDRTGASAGPAPGALPQAASIGVANGTSFKDRKQSIIESTHEKDPLVVPKAEPAGRRPRKRAMPFTSYNGPNNQEEYSDCEAEEEFDDEDPLNYTTDNQSAASASQLARNGRRKIEIRYIDDKSRRHITFSKRKAGIMKKAYELSTLTGTQVLLLVASETGHVYTFATPKLQPLIIKPEGKHLIQTCLNAPDGMLGGDYVSSVNGSINGNCNMNVRDALDGHDHCIELFMLPFCFPPCRTTQ